MLIPKTTNTELVKEMIGDDYIEIIGRNRDNSLEKWNARKERRKPELQSNVSYTNYLKGIPNEWCEILRQQCRLCMVCKTSTRNAVHMNLYHNVEIKCYKEIWICIKEYHEAEVEKLEERKRKNRDIIERLRRKTFIRYWRPILQAIREDTENKNKN